MDFTKEEISEIEKNLGYIVFDWAKHLINHIVYQARNSGVSTVYMNTPETLDAGSINEGKTEYFYTKLPPLLGFKLEKANLRGKGEEDLWAYHVNEKTANSFLHLIKTAKSYSINQIPKKYQGAFINILGNKPEYTEEEVLRVTKILSEKSEKKPKQKSLPKFYYDWDSRTWGGAQRFNTRVTENVVLQKLPTEVQNLIMNNDSLLKFWGFLLSQNQHFSNDTIGFALISKVQKDVWVINEIQTDVINAYMKLRRVDRETKDKSESLSFDTLKDMLVAQNKSKWVVKLENNEPFRNQILQNPNMINSLPDDTHDIDAWIKEQIAQGQAQGQVQGLDLIRHFNSVNFNRKIHRCW